MDLRDDDVHFQLRVVGYQFPNIAHGKWDPNWLVVVAKVTVEGHVFEHADPSVTTFELRGMLQWIEEIERHLSAFEAWRLQYGKRLRTEIGFTEPNLAFELWSGQPPSFRVRLAAEMVPPWAEQVLSARIERTASANPHAVVRAGIDTEAGEMCGVWLDFRVGSMELTAIEAWLRATLEQFPVRE